MLAALASSPATKALDPDPFPRHSLRHAVYAALLHFGFETASNKLRAAGDEIERLRGMNLAMFWLIVAMNAVVAGLFLIGYKTF